MAQNGSNSSQNFDFLTQKFKMAQTHLKSFNGRQGGILQSISGVFPKEVHYYQAIKLCKKRNAQLHSVDKGDINALMLVEFSH